MNTEESYGEKELTGPGHTVALKWWLSQDWKETKKPWFLPKRVFILSNV